MSWETRNGQNRYYYRKCRLDGKVVSKYVGGGLLAALAVKADVAERRHRAIERHGLAMFTQEQRSIDKAIANYRAQVRQVVRGELQQAGFHQHNGQWRFKRKGKAAKMLEKMAGQGTAVDADEFYSLMRIADKSAKPADVERFRQYAQEHLDLFDGFSLLAASTLKRVIESTDANEATKIVIAGEVHALRRELGGAVASPLEKLLINDVLICWVRLQLLEQLYCSDYTNSMSFAYADFLERRLSVTRRRYHQSVESLARVRRLLARAGVQINVAEQQVVVNS